MVIPIVNSRVRDVIVLYSASIADQEITFPRRKTQYHVVVRLSA